MRHLINHGLRWAIGGLLYGLLEIIWRGHTHWTMIVLGSGAVHPAGHCQRAYPVAVPDLGTGHHRGHGHHGGGAAGRVCAQSMAWPGRVGLLIAAWQPMGPDLPAVLAPVVPAGRAGHRGVRLAVLCAGRRREAALWEGHMIRRRDFLMLWRVQGVNMDQNDIRLVQQQRPMAPLGQREPLGLGTVFYNFDQHNAVPPFF